MSDHFGDSILRLCIFLKSKTQFGDDLPSGYLTVRHGKSLFLTGKPSINGPFSMAMLNNLRVYGWEAIGAESLPI